jgi:hypothetical protein
MPPLRIENFQCLYKVKFSYVHPGFRMDTSLQHRPVNEKRYSVETGSVKGLRFSLEVRCGAARQNLRQEKKGHYREELDDRSPAHTSSAGFMCTERLPNRAFSRFAATASGE